MDLDKALLLDEEAINALSQEDAVKVAFELEGRRSDLKKRHQLLFYQPASDTAKLVHLSTAKEIIVTGGNRSSKTETALVEALIQGTGIIPYCLEGVYPKIPSPPIRIRVVCKSITNVLEPIIKPKLQWWKWSGRDPEGGENGHWGWVPPHLLVGEDWSKSWSEKNRMLTLSNGTLIQFMSHDQDPEDFSGGSFHLILLDEGPPKAIYTENKMRTIDTGGQLIMSMTPPDEETAAWSAAWVYDELYTKGLPGPSKHPRIDSFTLFTESNRILSATQIDEVCSGLSESQKEVRMHGRFLHLSGRIYSMYTDRDQLWCFGCNKIIYLRDEEGRCLECRTWDTVQFCHHVTPFDEAYQWPAIQLIDPHPRKPNAIAWFAYGPTDDMWQVGELEIDDDPVTVWKRIREYERDLHISVYRRYMDPNMALSPSSSAKAAGGRTVRDEFDRIGMRCSLADDNRETARSRLRNLMKPDRKTGTPRFHTFTNCPTSNHQYMSYSWDEWTRYSQDTRDPKPKPREKDDDFPTLGGYAANAGLTFKVLKFGSTITHRKEKMIDMKRNDDPFRDRRERRKRGIVQ